jgi:hypothetical protein
MAFQTGTQIRPELARADVSGFARAGMITGQALANLGQDISKGIEKYEQNEAEKRNMAASLQLLKELGAVEGLSDESIKAGIKNAGGATNFLKTLGDMQALEEQSAVRQAQAKKATAEASRAAQSQNIEAINFDAREQAIAMNTRPDGTVDTSGLGSTYLQLGGRSNDDIDFFEDLSKQAEEGKSPELKVTEIDGFRVLMVNGQFKQAMGAGGEEADPAAVTVLKEKTKMYKQAEELYRKGDISGSQAILVALNAKDMFGRPQTPGDAFPNVKPELPTGTGTVLKDPTEDPINLGL